MVIVAPYDLLGTVVALAVAVRNIGGAVGNAIVSESSLMGLSVDPLVFQHLKRATRQRHPELCCQVCAWCWAVG